MSVHRTVRTLHKRSATRVIFFMVREEAIVNLFGDFEAEVDWGLYPSTQEYTRIQRDYNQPSRSDPFSGFTYYEDRANTASSSDRPRRHPRDRALVRYLETGVYGTSTKKEKKPKAKKMKTDPNNLYEDLLESIGPQMLKGMRAYNTVKGFAKNFQGTENQMTKDMIIGPHRKRTLGGRKKVNVGKQLKQLVDDTKVFKTQFKLKIQSESGLRQWAQMICRYRQAPGFGTGEPTIHGKVLDPDVIGEIAKITGTYDYYSCLPPVPRAELDGSTQDVYNITKFATGPGSENLFFLNLPLTYMEQDMYNMGMGPGKRDFTSQMAQGRGQPGQIATQIGSPYGVPTTLDKLSGPSAAVGLANSEHLGMSVDYDYNHYYGMDRTRFTNMMRAVHPIANNLKFKAKAGGQRTNGKFTDEFTYNFRMGWGIHLLDYNVLDISKETSYDGGPSNTQTSPNDPQYLRTNNSINTVATIKDGSISYSMNNMGESQCYVTTLVVVNKHVDDHYWSMPEALTDSYLKAAQTFLSSGEWSIVNNITDAMEQQGGVKSEGSPMNAYMYVTHPSIKPFGKVPARFLEEFHKHFVIKMYTTTKLGIGERQSVQYNLGGLQYSTEQLAMSVEQRDGEVNTLPAYYYPILEKDPANARANQKAVFPYCCQQGTTHFLFGVQGMSLPFLSGDGSDVTKVEGRWAVPALVDIQGTYKEVIAPLSTKQKNATPIQKCLTALPNSTWKSVVTTLPRVRATADKGLASIGFP